MNYTPRGAAKQLFECRDTEILIEGPAGTGKSRAVLEKLNAIACKYPNCRLLMVRKTRNSMNETVLPIMEQYVLADGTQLAPVKTGPRAPHRSAYDYPNGARIVLGGMDNADRIMSSEYDIIAVFEAVECLEEDFEKLKSRLRSNIVPYQQIIADCNPAQPTHWLNQRAHAGKMTRLLSRHEDNPKVDEPYLEILRSLSGVRRKRLYEGKWCAAEGAVYPDFDPKIHVIEPFEIPEDWPRLRSIDFGYTNPFVCQWWAIDGDGRMYMYREFYRSRTLVEDAARTINKYEKCGGTVADHDAEGRETLHRRGIGTVPAIKDIERGVQAVEDRLRVQPDGKPRLFLFKNSLLERDPRLVDAKKPCGLLEEIDSYQWPAARPEKEAKESPLKLDDHACDAMRYAVAHMDLHSRPMAFSIASTPDSTDKRRELLKKAQWLDIDNDALFEEIDL